MKFEGEYLNGRKWKGKRYDRNNKLVFKLKDGKGHVKEYNYNSDLKYEGLYLNGQRNGEGKEYNSEDTLLFEREYLNGERNGKGKEYNTYNNKIFEGEYLFNFKRKGKAKDIIKKVI